MNTANIITLAHKHVGNNAVTELSARWSLADAVEAQNGKQDGAARMSALRSMAYSIGSEHPDYQSASALLPGKVAIP